MNRDNRYIETIVRNFNAKLAEHKIPQVFLRLINDLHPERGGPTRDRFFYTQNYELRSEYSPQKIMILFSLIYDLSQLPEHDDKTFVAAKGIDSVRKPRFLEGMLDEMSVRGRLDVVQEGEDLDDLFGVEFTGRRITSVTLAENKQLKVFTQFEPRLAAIQAASSDLKSAIDVAFEMYVVR